MIRSAAACLPVASVMSCDHTTLSAPIVIMIIIIVLIIIIIIYRRSSESFLPDHSCQLPTRPVLWSHNSPQCRQTSQQTHTGCNKIQRAVDHSWTQAKPQSVLFTSAVQVGKLPDCCQPAFVYAGRNVTQASQRYSGRMSCVWSVAAKGPAVELCCNMAMREPSVDTQHHKLR